MSPLLYEQIPKVLRKARLLESVDYLIDGYFLS